MFDEFPGWGWMFVILLMLILQSMFTQYARRVRFEQYSRLVPIVPIEERGLYDHYFFEDRGHHTSVHNDPYLSPDRPNQSLQD